jgi:RNA polymerase sigma factor (sigma-70 family)
MQQSPPDTGKTEPSLLPEEVQERLVVVAAAHHDREAFAMLYERYMGPLLQRMLYLVNNKEIALDLCHDTFVRVWVHFSKPGHGQKEIIENFEPWINEIARNLAYDRFRRTKKFEFISLSQGEPNDPKEYALSVHPNLIVAGHEEQVCERRLIEEALAAMSPQYRICYVLQTVWGLKQAEIAAELGISASTVSTNVRRAYKQLRKIGRKMMGDYDTKGGRKRNGKKNNIQAH